MDCPLKQNVGRRALHERVLELTTRIHQVDHDWHQHQFCSTKTTTVQTTQCGGKIESWKSHNNGKWFKQTSSKNTSFISRVLQRRMQWWSRDRASLWFANHEYRIAWGLQKKAVRRCCQRLDPGISRQIDPKLAINELTTPQNIHISRRLCGQSESVRMDIGNKHQSSESINTDESIPHGMASRWSCSWLARSASRPKIPRWLEQHWSLRTCTCKRNGWFMACTNGIKTPPSRSLSDWPWSQALAIQLWGNEI